MAQTVSRTVILRDQELWSLLHGSGPKPSFSPPRILTPLERWEEIKQRLLTATEGLPGHCKVSLVIEVRER